jgi:hypothetical protein
MKLMMTCARFRLLFSFHAIASLLQDAADYFLRQDTGHFIASQEASEGRAADALVEVVSKEIIRRVDEGWLEP